MNKKIIALLLALLMILSLTACKEKAEEESSNDAPVSENELISESDWRDEGKYQSAEAVVGGKLTKFLVSVADDRAAVYYDEQEQKLYGMAVYPDKLSDKEFTRYQLELSDLNNDGNADLTVPYLEADSDIANCWYYLWDSSIEDFVYDSEFAPEVSEEESEEESSEESKEEPAEESSEESSEPEKKKITLFLDKSFVSGAAEVIPLEIEYEGEFGPGDAVNAIAEETWLNFSLVYQPYGEDIYIYWSESSTLHNTPTSLNPKYGLTDDAGLRWFMLDTLATTFKEMGYKNVFYQGEGGGDLVLTRVDEVTVIAGDVPYGGSGDTTGRVTGINNSMVAQQVLQRVFTTVGGDSVSIAFMTESTVENEHCYIYIVTDNAEGAMSAETYFAVSDSGKIYAYDPASEAYIPYSF